MDYALPRADDLPDIEVELVEIPCTTNPLGVKGAGEAGAVGSPPAVINALIDALARRRGDAYRHAGDAGEGVEGDGAGEGGVGSSRRSIALALERRRRSDLRPDESPAFGEDRVAPPFRSSLMTEGSRLRASPIAKKEIIHMAGRIEAKLAELGITLPTPDAADRQLRALCRHRQSCRRCPARFRRATAPSPSPARSGVNLSIEQGKEAARLCFINVLVHLKAACDGDLDRVQPRGAAGRVHRLAARVHPARAGDERRVGPRGRGVRRGWPPRPHHDRRSLAAGRRGGGSGRHVRDRLGT